MPIGVPPGRRGLDVVFGLFLATGVTVGAYALWATADWIHSQGEGAFGMFYLGAFSFVPSGLAWVVGGVRLFLGPRDRDVRLGVGVTTVHLVWWVLLIGIELLRDDPSWGWVMRSLTIVEPGLYTVGVMALAARWFGWRRRRYPVPVAALTP